MVNDGRRTSPRHDFKLHRVPSIDDKPAKKEGSQHDCKLHNSPWHDFKLHHVLGMTINLQLVFGMTLNCTTSMGTT